jgi:hypothetical protein
MKSQHFLALGRFWWLLTIGAGIAIIAAVAMVARISTGLPPKVMYRSQPTYSATQLELVTARNNPFLRTEERTIIQRPAQTQPVQGRGSADTVTTVPQTPVVQSQTPNVDVLVRAANYYPYLIQSDQVVAIRNQRFGQLKGEVTAQALNSFQTGSRFRASTFPIVQVVGTAPMPEQAKKVTRATVAAFREWLTKSQNAARVPESERVLIQDLQRPDKAVAAGGPKHGLDIIVGLAVFAAFGGVALALDKLLSRTQAGGAARRGAEARTLRQLDLDLEPVAAGDTAADEASDLTAARWAADGPGV